jgi:hypothetical protein
MSEHKSRAEAWPRRLVLGISAATLALLMALSVPLSASAATSILWEGNATRGSWVGSGTPKSNKINAYGLTQYVTRVGVRVNGSVSNGAGSLIVTYSTKTNADIFCRWDQGLGTVRSIKCVNYW